MKMNQLIVADTSCTLIRLCTQTIINKKDITVTSLTRLIILRVMMFINKRTSLIGIVKNLKDTATLQVFMITVIYAHSITIAVTRILTVITQRATIITVIIIIIITAAVVVVALIIIITLLQPSQLWIVLLTLDVQSHRTISTTCNKTIRHQTKKLLQKMKIK